MQVQAVGRYIRVSPRKMNIMGELVRGKTLPEARRALLFRPERASRLLLAILDSAAANAYENHSLDTEELVVRSIVVGQGPRLKRFTPKAFGRAAKIRKPTSHITVVVEGARTVVKTKRVSSTVRGAPKKSGTESSTPQSGETPQETHGKGPVKSVERKGFFRRIFQRKSGM